MEYPKFILTGDGHLRLGMVTLHRHLLERGDQCLGGGYYKIDYVHGALVLSGASSDYGAPRWNEVDTIIMPAGFYGMAIEVDYGGARRQNLADSHTVTFE